MVNGLPLQIVFENEFTEAEGFTVMITVNEFPVPQAVVGVTVQVAVCATLLVLFKVPLKLDWLLAEAPPNRLAVMEGKDHA